MVGQIARDLVLVVDEVPGPSGSTDVRQRRELLGGKGANIAVGLSRLDVPVAVVGVVGDDQVGENLLAQCTRDSIDTSAVTRRPETESALMVDVVTADGQWRYLESVPDPALLTPTDLAIASEILGKASTVILQLQQPAAAILAALDRVRPECRVIMDGVPDDESTRDRILAAATVLRLDAQEAELLAGQEIPDEAAARAVAQDLLSRGPELVVIAVGTDGNLLAWPGDADPAPAGRRRRGGRHHRQRRRVRRRPDLGVGPGREPRTRRAARHRGRRPDRRTPRRTAHPDRGHGHRAG